MIVSRSMRRHALTPSRALASLAAVVTVALVGASAAMGATDPAPGAEPSPSATPKPTGTAADVTATLEAYGPFVVVDGQSVAATLGLTNASPYPVPKAAASLSITKRPLTSRADLAAFYEDPRAAPMRKLKSVAIGVPDLDEDDEPLGTGTLAGNASAQVRVAASSKDLSLPRGTAGVYGVIASYRIGGTTVVVDAMALTWHDAEVDPLPVTAIATVSGQPARASALLAGADVPGVSLLVDPTSLTAAAPTDVLRSHELYMLPATNPDVPSLAHAGDTELIDFALDQSRTRDWSTVADSPWVALSPVADQSVAGWAAGGGAVATLFDREAAQVTPKLPVTDGRVPPVVTVTIADDKQAPLVVPDAYLSDLIATFRPGDPAGPSRIVAETALLAFAGDGTQGIVASPGLGLVVPDEGPSANLEALMVGPWVAPRNLADALSDPGIVPVKLPKAADVAQDLPVDNVHALADRLSGLAVLSQTANNPNMVLVPGGNSLLSGVSASVRGDAERQAAGFAAAITAVDATLGAVGIVQSSDVNLIATSGEVPFTVRNDLDVDSTVTVVMRSTSPNLRVRDRPVVTVPAGGETTAMVPVEAVSSANVALKVWLVNADGDAVSAPQDFTMRVRADWGNAATAVFTGLLVLVLIGGIIRTIRRGRKDTRTGPGGPAQGAKIVDDIDD